MSHGAPGSRQRGPGPMGPPGMGMMPAQKAKDPKKTLATLGKYLFPFRVKIGLVMFFAVLSTGFSIVGPKLLGKITTKLVEGLVAYYMGTGLLTDFRYMGNMASLLAVLYIISAICAYAQGFIMSRVSMTVTYNIRKETSQKLNRLPLSYYDTRTHGEVLSRITNDIDTLNQTLAQNATQVITSIVSVLGILVMMISISWLMTLAAVIVVPVSAAIMMLIFKNSQQYFIAQQKYIGEVNGQVEEVYGGHNIVQAFNQEDASLATFEVTNEKLFSSAWKSQFVTSIMQPMMGFIGNLGYVMVCVLGGYLAIKKVVMVGDIQAFIQYMRNFTQPIAQLSAISNTLQSTIAASERVFEFLEEREETPDAQGHEEIDAFRGTVKFSHVRFGYNADKVIINDFSADVAAGQKVAIVGPTGAGKTTIVKLLMRFYDINSGGIEIDGHDIYAMPRTELRSIFGMVLQDTWLYNASIMDNIRYGTFGATDEQVILAAKAAHCDEFIRALPGGYDMILNEDASNVSQGQKQLFTIARVILANPRILILDEATSSVDTRTEIQIQKAMDHLMSNRTSFVIAHRLSTIRDADLILVLNNGDIVEQGNHQQLLALNGFYAGLYNSQFVEGEPI